MDWLDLLAVQGTLKVNEVHIFREVQAKVMEAEEKEQPTRGVGRMGISEDFTEEMVFL